MAMSSAHLVAALPRKGVPREMKPIVAREICLYSSSPSADTSAFDVLVEYITITVFPKICLFNDNATKTMPDEDQGAVLGFWVLSRS